MVSNKSPYNKYKKTHYTQFKTKNKPTKDLNIVCKEQPLSALSNKISWHLHKQFDKVEMPY